MFENCNTLLDLNKARLEAIKKNPDNLMTINSEYQKRRKDVLTSQPTYKSLKPMRPNVVQHPRIMGIPYGGPSDEELTIKYTQKGFVC